MSAPPPRSIHSPRDLASLLVEIKQAVVTGAIHQVRPDAAPFASHIDARELNPSGPYPDYIEMRFEERSTGMIYCLEVETYHGSGGRWGPQRSV